MCLDQMRDSIRAAYRMSRDWGRPAFVFRPRVQPRNPVSVTLDEELARTQADEDGYTRCDAAEGKEEGDDKDDDAIYW